MLSMDFHMNKRTWLSLAPSGKIWVRVMMLGVAVFILAVQSAPAVPSPLVVAESDFSIVGDIAPFRASWAFQSPEANLMLATLTLSAPQATAPPPLTVKWNFPAIGLAAVWVSDHTKANFDHQGLGVESRAVLRAPLVTLLGPDDANRLTVALSDAVHPVRINCGVKEEDLNMYASVKLFGGKWKKETLIF